MDQKKGTTQVMTSRVVWEVARRVPGIERHGYKWRARMWRDGKKLASGVRDSISDALTDLELMRRNIPIHRGRVKILSLEQRKGKWRAYFKDRSGKKINGPMCRCRHEAQLRAASLLRAAGEVAGAVGGAFATPR